MKNWIRRVGHLLGKVIFVGWSDKQTYAHNRVTTFTNAIAYFTCVTCLSVFSQLESFGAPKIATQLYYGLVGLALIAILFNYLHKYLAARLTILLTGFLAGCTGGLIFGKTFNGHYVFFIIIVYSVLAFSRQKLWLRIAAVLFAYSGLPLMDYLSYYHIFPITGLNSKDFPLSVLMTDTFIDPFFIIITIWIEKTLADRHELQLENSLQTIRREKQKTKAIFDHIDLGIVLVDSSLTLDSEYSRKTEDIFQSKNVAGSDIVQFMSAHSNLSKESSDTTKDILNIAIGEDYLNWQLNVSHLPTEFIQEIDGQKRYVNVAWTPIVNIEQVERVIVTFKDVTGETEAKKELELGRLLEDRSRQILACAIKVGAGQTLQFITELERFCAELTPNLKLLFNDVTARNLHTLKGEARLLGLIECSQRLHRLEDFIAEANIGSELIDFWGSIAQYVAELKLVSQKMFGSLKLDQMNWSLLNYMSQLKVKIKDQLSNKKGHYYIHKITVEDEVSEWPPQIVSDLQKILMLAVQNCVDHGYLLHPEGSAAIEIKVRASQQNGKYCVQVEDWGHGIDLERLSQIGRERGLPEGQVIYDILFFDKVSTATSVSQTSGRGVGLSAIQFMVKNLGGKVRIENAIGHRGTCLTIEV